MKIMGGADVEDRKEHNDQCEAFYIGWHQKWDPREKGVVWR